MCALFAPYGVPERTTVKRDGGEWTVSTIQVAGGVENIAFEEGGRDRQVYVSGRDHVEAVERFRAVENVDALENLSTV